MPDKERLLELFRNMILIRRFEETVYEFHQQKLFGGHYHLYIGQEATGAGVMASLVDDDRIFSTHRNHGHLIARGINPKNALAPKIDCRKSFLFKIYLLKISVQIYIFWV